jgi:hypothetical protein
MAFERATLKAPANTATRLIGWGLATGLRRQRARGCGGLTRTSLGQPTRHDTFLETLNPNSKK